MILFNADPHTFRKVWPVASLPQHKSILRGTYCRIARRQWFHNPDAFPYTCSCSNIPEGLSPWLQKDNHLFLALSYWGWKCLTPFKEGGKEGFFLITKELHFHSCRVFLLYLFLITPYLGHCSLTFQNESHLGNNKSVTRISQCQPLATASGIMTVLWTAVR